MASTIEKKQIFIEGVNIENLPVEGYEKVLKITHKPSKLTAIIAIHDTTLGPALGGTRIYPYKTFDDALKDALRLAKGMTYKSAVAEVGYGGGKSVIIADPKTDKTDELLHAFGTAVEMLCGEYIAAEDVGCSVADVVKMNEVTQYVTGIPKGSGDPGYFTAWGTCRSIQATCQHLWGTDSVEGKTVLIQGLGNVGMYLAEYLFWHGANLIVSDIDQSKVDYAIKRYQATAIAPEEVYSYSCDIYAPCALGGVINKKTVPLFQCKAVVGAANNQLDTDEDADALSERGIYYAPDFVVNAGGLLNVASELERDGYSPKNARKKTNKIYDSIIAIYKIAEKNKVPTHRAAVSLADYRIKYRIGMRIEKPYFHR